jgi:hypothetical protein
MATGAKRLVAKTAAEEVTKSRRDIGSGLREKSIFLFDYLKTQPGGAFEPSPAL